MGICSSAFVSSSPGLLSSASSSPSSHNDSKSSLRTEILVCHDNETQVMDWSGFTSPLAFKIIACQRFGLPSASNHEIYLCGSTSNASSSGASLIRPSSMSEFKNVSKCVIIGLFKPDYRTIR